MSDPESDAAARIIVLFRSRARSSKRLAFGILALIFVLLAGGAATFIYAPQIASSDLNNSADFDNRIAAIEPEYKQIRANIDKQRQADEAELAAKQAKYINWKTFVTGCLSRYATLSSVSPLNRTTVDKPGLILDSKNGCDKRTFIEYLRNFKDNTPLITFGIVMPDESEGSMVLYGFTGGAIQNIAQAVNGFRDINNPEIPPFPTQINRVDEGALARSSLLEQALMTLRAQKTSQSIAALTGNAEKNSPNKSQNNVSGGDEYKETLAQLIPTNITRFGTIILITFLVSILTPLYRYNIRLSSYYDARGDDLELSGSKYKNASFATLATSLTPTFDFGKSPSTPIEQIIELAKHLKGESKGDKDDV